MRDRPSESLNHLLERWLAGDQQAAARLWRRHAPRLLGLARKHLSADSSRQLDAEDVVQSVYLKFFAAARSHAPMLQESEDLWRLLVAILRNKLRDHHKHRRTLKRQGEAAESLDANSVEVRDRQPAPLEQVAGADEVSRLLGAFKPGDQHIVALRLDGWKVEEIAQVTDSHERTIRRVLKRVQSHLRERGEECG